MLNIFLISTVLLFASSCSKSSNNTASPVTPALNMNLLAKKINDQVVSASSVQLQTNKAVLLLSFSEKIDRSTVANAVTWNQVTTSSNVPVSVSFANGDSALIIQPLSPLAFLSRYSVAISTGLKSIKGGSFSSSFFL